MLVYVATLAIHLFNTIVVYQIWMGSRIKSLSHDQKMTDLTKIRWFASLTVASVAPIAALILNRSHSYKIWAVTDRVSWVCTAGYVLIILCFYVFGLDSKGRKDALIPAKRHAYYLFFTIPPMIFVYEVFFSRVDKS